MRYDSLFRTLRPEKASPATSLSPRFRLFDCSEAPLNGVIREEIVTVTEGEQRRERGTGRHTTADAAAREDEQRMFRQVLDLGAPAAVRDIEVQSDGPGEILSASEDGVRYKTIARFPGRGYKRVSATYRYWRLSCPLMPAFNRPSVFIAAHGAMPPVKAQGGSRGLKETRSAQRD